MMIWMRAKRKLKVPSLLLLLGCLLVFTVYHNGQSDHPRFMLAGEQQKGCHLPRLNPFDPSILKFIEKTQPLKCDGTQFELTYLSEDEWLQVNRTAITVTGLQLSCFYRCFERIDGNDQQLKYSEWIQIDDQVRPGCEFMETYCKKTTFPGATVYHNNRNQVLRRNISSVGTADGKKSVIVIVFDSISHSNFIRNMPKSFKVLQSLYRSHIFNGMNKVGDQSFPNAVAFLAGRDQRTEFGDTTSFFDDHPLIWKDFENIGYNTYYAEDYPKFNLFNYLAKGFRHKPVHHYFRPFWLNVYGSYLHRKSKYLCYGNHAMHNIQLNYLSQFLRKYKGSPQFALNWLTELGHDYMNQVHVADEDFAVFLTRHYDLLKDSFLFVLGDHGHRFDAIRHTTVGRIEERLPFFSMHLPEDLRQKYPRLSETVEKNTQVLTSFWDFHKTMQVIHELSYSNQWETLNGGSILPSKNDSNRGLSLFRPIKDRNCYEADIPDELCVCKVETNVDPREPKIQQLANELVRHLNKLLISSEKCAKLTLLKVLHATVVEDNELRPEVHYRITVEVAPSLALFEALLKYNRVENRSSIYPNVNRINAYGTQSTCIYDQELRKFCYCISSTDQQA